MPRYFTHYWANETVEKAQALGEDRLEYVAGNLFVRRGVSVGDVVYPVTVVEGVLRLLGSLEVGKVCGLVVARKDLGYDPPWKASDYLLTAEPLPTRFDLEISPETTRSLRFANGERTESPVFVSPDRLDQQPCEGYASSPQRPPPH